MRELEAILSAYDVMKAKKQACVLATVVHVEGSSYRQAGARMLMNEQGLMIGSISGGCLEGDALRKALFALQQGQNKLVTYDTSDEEDAVVGAQLGCNGVIQVLFEPVDFQQPDNPVELLKKAADRRDTVAIVTLFNLQKNKKQPGTKMLLDAGMNMTGNIGNPDFSNALQADVRQAFAENSSLFGEYHIAGEKRHAFIEICRPVPELVLVGAGNDAQVLAQMADLLGWRVAVADGRYTHANGQRFNGSCQVIVAKPEKILDRIRIGARTVFVLMTHNYQYDLAVLKLLLPHPEIPYIGILGPQKRYRRMLDELYSQGIHVAPEQAARIYAPMGLDLGGENASEIALSVLSEMLAVLNHSGGSHLRERSGPIHDRIHHAFKVKPV